VVAWYLGIDPATVVRYAERGIIPGHPLVEVGTRMHCIRQTNTPCCFGSFGDALEL